MDKPIVFHSLPLPVELGLPWHGSRQAQGVGQHGVSLGGGHCSVDHPLWTDLQRPKHVVHAEPRKNFGEGHENPSGCKWISSEQLPRSISTINSRLKELPPFRAPSWRDSLTLEVIRKRGVATCLPQLQVQRS